MSKVFPFSALPTAELIIDAVYEGGTKGNTARTTFSASSFLVLATKVDFARSAVGVRLNW
jgi:hypothetical protein